MTSFTATGIAYDRAGPPSGPTVVLVHAGVADRRMWDPQWPQLIEGYDVLRVDLRGFGESVSRPEGRLDQLTDLIETLGGLGIARAHLIGASFGAGLAVGLALAEPSLVASLLLSAPGGSLMSTLTSDLQTFFDAERHALADGDIDAAVEANLVAWVDGVGRSTPVDPAVRARVGQMQRQAFEVGSDWDQLYADEVTVDPMPDLDRISVPVTVLVGGLDRAAIALAAAEVATRVADARLIRWPDVAHLPSMERPADFLALVAEAVRE